MTNVGLGSVIVREVTKFPKLLNLFVDLPNPNALFPSIREKDLIPDAEEKVPTVEIDILESNEPLSNVSNRIVSACTVDTVRTVAKSKPARAFIYPPDATSAAKIGVAASPE